MYIGIDLGGTNIAAALVDESGVIVERASIPTDKSGGAKSVTAGLFSVCEELTRGKSAPRSIGIGIPGTVNDKTGEIVFTPNLPIGGVNIAAPMREKFGCEIHLDNDANCAALGEVVAGGAKGARDVVFITLGTGVGGGILIGGNLYSGINGAAGELGHMVIIAGGRDCGCGRKGCWERYASASGLNRTAVEFMRTHEESSLWELCGGDFDMINGKIVFDAYRANDAAARLIVDRYVEHLAIGVVNLINIFSPELFCVGGGISSAWDCISGPLQTAVDAEKYTRFSTHSPQTLITKAQLGNDAGIIGAAMLGSLKG